MLERQWSRLVRTARLTRLGGIAGRRLRGHLEDHLAGLGQSHLFARDLLDGVGIGLERVDVLGKLLIFVVEPLDLAAQLFDLPSGCAAWPGSRARRRRRESPAPAAPRPESSPNVAARTAAAPASAPGSCARSCVGENPRPRVLAETRRFLFRGRFRIDAQQRLGAGKPQQHPRRRRRTPASARRCGRSAPRAVPGTSRSRLSAARWCAPSRRRAGAGSRAAASIRGPRGGTDRAVARRAWRAARPSFPPPAGRPACRLFPASGRESRARRFPRRPVRWRPSESTGRCT